jgi:hypothetical protein
VKAAPYLHPLEQFDPKRFETPAILEKLATSSRRLRALYECHLSSYIVRTTISSIKTALQDYKHRKRKEYKFYGQDLITNLFT